MHASFKPQSEQNLMPHSLRHSPIELDFGGIPNLHVRPLVLDPYEHKVKPCSFIVIEINNFDEKLCDLHQVSMWDCT